MFRIIGIICTALVAYFLVDCGIDYMRQKKESRITEKVAEYKERVDSLVAEYSSKLKTVSRDKYLEVKDELIYKLNQLDYDNQKNSERYLKETEEIYRKVRDSIDWYLY